jgi:hypothetical protein
MLDTPAPTRRSTSATSAAALVRRYLMSRGDTLAMAIERLGGPPAFARLCRLREGLNGGRTSLRRIVTELRFMHGLLTLEHVGDPDRDESGPFAAISPADPKVHDYCLLAEEVERLLRHVRRLMPSGAGPGRAVRESAPAGAHGADTVGATETVQDVRVAA